MGTAIANTSADTGANTSANASAPDLPDLNAVVAYLRDLQDNLCRALEKLDGKAKFTEDKWKHKETDGGGGITRTLRDGELFEKGGVNFSHVRGRELPAAASAQRPQLAAHPRPRPFEAAGVSLVMHPRNPYVPCCHMNIRFFIAPPTSDTQDTNAPIWWFGGGYDLTPCYAFAEDCIHWHQTAKQACAPFGTRHYAKLKAACDRYFYLPHRNETRGIGGLFFDDYCEGGFARAFAFARNIGDSFLPAYRPIAERRRAMKYGERERDFQSYRRGRYVEFNLVYDRGTLFGLQSGGRSESILMSLPPMARWEYAYRAAPKSAEQKLVDEFLKPRDWLAADGE